MLVRRREGGEGLNCGLRNAKCSKCLKVVVDFEWVGGLNNE